MPDNVFVLCTGKCGSRTWEAACRHIENWTTGHESRAAILENRLRYPAQHIEIDNRLSWFLGSLGRRYPEALYVHLRRDPEAVARSFATQRDGGSGILPAFGERIVRTPKMGERLSTARLMVRTMTENVEAFIEDRQSVTVWIEDPHEGFDEMCDRIGAVGDIHAAHDELRARHGESGKIPIRAIARAGR